MLYQGRMWGLAHWSRVWLHDVGHVPCHCLGVQSALPCTGEQECTSLVSWECCLGLASPLDAVPKQHQQSPSQLIGVLLPAVPVVVWFSFMRSFLSVPAPGLWIDIH